MRAATATARARRLRRWVLALWLLTLASAIAVVTARHHNRLAFIAWRQAESAHRELQFERGRLLLEKATWARRRNIADEARARWAMAAPLPAKIITINLGGGE